MQKTEFEYTYQISRKVIFEVRYYTLGSNKHPYFSTSAAQFNQPKTDFNQCGQAQDSLLPRNTAAFKFYSKWDKLHCKDLTDREYTAITADIEVLKAEYNYIEKGGFEAQKDLSKLPIKKVI